MANRALPGYQPQPLRWRRRARAWFFYLAAKERITIRLDPDITEWFPDPARVGGNHQTLINEALREHIERQSSADLESTLRPVLREELTAANPYPDRWERGGICLTETLSGNAAAHPDAAHAELADRSGAPSPPRCLCRPWGRVVGGQRRAHLDR